MDPATGNETPHQFALMRQRRFAPYFWTMFLGAFNDNVYKNALVILLAFQGATVLGMSGNDVVNLAGALFIAPYAVLSATAGQLADKLEKSMLIRRIKLLEIVIMAVGAAGFLLHDTNLLMLMLFGLGAQAALFGPVKYALLPQHLSDAELTGGNGLVETGTYVAILTGTLLGGMLIADRVHGPLWVSAATLACAALGYLAARGIPWSAASDPGVAVNWNLLAETARNWRMIRARRTLWLCVLGNSWFWFYGAIFLAQVPGYTRDILHGDEHVATLLLATFSIGIGIGSLLCEKLSGGRIEIGLVPFGSIGMTALGLAVGLLPVDPLPPGVAPGLAATLSLPHTPWALACFAGMGVFGGFYIVPLYATLQARGDARAVARVIASNNIMNAGFIVVSAFFALAMFHLGLTIPQLFVAVALLNAAVAAYIFSLVPEFLLRFLVWLLVHTLYRVRTRGLRHVPDHGPALLVCNHVSYIDALVIGSLLPRLPRFITDHQVYKAPVVNTLMRLGRAIPIASSREDPSVKERAFEAAAQALRDGELVMIFPEGMLTRTGDINPFRGGVEEILKRQAAPVVPMALRGLWGSFFSRIEGGRAMVRPFRRGMLNRIELEVGEPVPPSEAGAERLQLRVAALRGDVR